MLWDFHRYSQEIVVSPDGTARVIEPDGSWAQEFLCDPDKTETERFTEYDCGGE